MKKSAVSAMKASRKAMREDEDENDSDDEEDDEDEEEDDEEAEPPAKKARAMKKASVIAMKRSMKAGKKGKEAESDSEEEEDEDESAEENTVAERRKELKAMDKAALKKLLEGSELEAGLKGEMVEAVLVHEAKGREKLKAHEAKAQELLIQKGKELQAKSNADLKDLCQEKNLKLGGTKEDRIERLLAIAKQDGEIDKALAGQARDARREELFSMDKTALVKLCDTAGVDPFVKEVMVERIILHEDAQKPANAGVAPTTATKKERTAPKARATKAMKAMKAK